MGIIYYLKKYSKVYFKYNILNVFRILLYGKENFYIFLFYDILSALGYEVVIGITINDGKG